MKSNLVELKEHFEFKKHLATVFAKHHKSIQDWFKKHESKIPYHLTTSVDIRDSGKKIVPVDCNLFPAGFNNICPEDLRTTPQHMRKVTEPLGKKVVVIGEENTRNKFYNESLFKLADLLSEAGHRVQLGWIGSHEDLPDELESATGEKRKTQPLQYRESSQTYYLTTQEGEFTPDWMLLNHDLSGGLPPILTKVSNQPILPNPSYGWFQRTKAQNFKIYNQLIDDLCTLIPVDPWTFKVLTEEVNQIDFNEGANLDKVKDVAQRVLLQSKREHDERGIPYEPFVYVKNNAGTYGMGIHVFHSADEVTSLNRREKNKLSVGKNKSQIHSVVVQEGVPTQILIDRLVAEPVVYLFGGTLIGGFFRAHESRNQEENLNSQGVVFRKMCMTDASGLHHGELTDDCVYETVYGTIGKISALAAAMEIMPKTGGQS